MNIDNIWEWVEENEARKRELVPDVKTGLNLLFDAYSRLKDLGFNDIIYCPKDGTVFEAIEAGCTAIADCYYEGNWPDGSWWIISDGDLWPSRPILFRLKEKTNA